MAVTSDFVNLLEPILHEAIFMKFEQQPDDFMRILNVEGSQKNKETDVTISDLGPLTQKSESAAVTYENPVEGFKTEYTHITYSGGFRVSEELAEDDLFNVIQRYPQALARSASDTLNRVGIGKVNNGFTTTEADGVALFSAAHPLVNDSEIGSNVLAASADLSETSLQDAINVMEQTVSDSNLIHPVMPSLLLVPTVLQFRAAKLLESAQAPGTADNDINSLRMKRIQWMSSPYLTDTDAWFLRSDIHSMNLFIRKALAVMSTFDFDTSDMKTKATVRFSAGVSDWRGWFGSPGA